MFELEALFLGLEPVTALAVGAGALILVPVLSTVDSMTGSNLSESTRSVAKDGLVWAFEVFDKAQHAVAEAGESVQDLIAEAKAEMTDSRNGSDEKAPREVTIG
jgi:Protein of unknown function (DUF5132)